MPKWPRFSAPSSKDYQLSAIECFIDLTLSCKLRIIISKKPFSFLEWTEIIFSFIPKKLYFYTLCFCFSALTTGKAEAIVMGEDFAANAAHSSSHSETEAPMAYYQLHGNPAKKRNKKILDRALGIPKPRRNPQDGITNLPGAAFPSYGDVPLLEPYPGAKTVSEPGAALPPPYPGGPSEPGVYGNHSIIESNTP
ncbi:hypothetical protein FAI41_05155 [Acetobacteraceae bacterium]|nr:hypothetical protein FAI41_05155 [Acetobacteraceae bacterium]